MLAAVLVLEFVSFSLLSPYFLDVDTLSDATFNFTERALVALPLALLIIAGEIDISVAATIALASVAMGFAVEAGGGIGTPGGWGWARVRGGRRRCADHPGRVPSIVATIGTMTLFGASLTRAGGQVLENYPGSFAVFGQDISPVPCPSSCFLRPLRTCLAVFLHDTHARASYAIGANPVGEAFAGSPSIAIDSRCSR